MLSSKMKALACGVSTACLMAFTTASQADQTFHIGVAANFANSLNDIIAAFDNAYGYNPNLGTITYTSDSTANLQACITGGTCPAGPYDLFLAANTAAAVGLASSYGMIYPGTTRQSAFFYAVGSLVFASNNTNVNNCPTVCGLPTSPSNFVIADPSKAPYGLAALQVLNQMSTYSTVTTLGPFTSPLNTSPNIGTTWQAVNSAHPTYAYGFIAKSQVCQNGNLSSAHITSVFEYNYSGASVPGTQFGHTATTPTYGEIIQDGLPIQQSSQTTGTQAAILAFVNYLTTNVSSPAYTQNDGKGYAVIQRYCYGLTP